MRFIVASTILISTFAVAQSVSPTLSTSDKVAITSLEQTKQAAQKQYSDAQQQEASIVQEWNKAHPGYHVNPQTYVVEADPKQEVAKPAEMKK